MVVELPECYQNVVDAIIMRAVKDYRDAVRFLPKNPTHPVALERKEDVETFFRSQWFKDLCDLDGEMLIERIQKEAKYT